jgi:hypothetical protein
MSSPLAALLSSALLGLAVTAVACGGSSGSSSGSAVAPGTDPDGGGTTDPDGGAVTPIPPGGPCAVTKKGTAGLLLQGRVLGASGPIDGEVLIDAAGTITCTDASCAAGAGYADATTVKCTGAVIAPGLVNAHDHTDYNAHPPLAHGQKRWAHRHGWRTGAGGETPLPKYPSTADVKVIAAAELRFLVGGATTVNGSGGVGGLIRNAAAFQNKAQLEGLKSPAVFFDTFPLGDSNGTLMATGCGYPNIRSASTAFKNGAAYAPHISEGVNGAAENEFVCLKDTLVTEQTAIIHAVGLNATDVGAIASAKAKVIWSARTNVDLYGNTAPVTLLKTMGVTMGLGTDWLASGSMNMLRELACVDSLNDKYFAKAFDDRALVEMATKGSATALKLESEIGELAAGRLADIAVFYASTTKDYRAVIEGTPQDVALVLRGGRVMFGDAAIVEALSPGCGELPVCGVTKKVCVDTPGVTLADITAAAAASYPLFFCKGETPKDEPSCVPYRDTYPNGTSATDRDGDGVPDATDNCPSVFNPPRPLDGTAQADVDGDGAGDACDAKPLDASAK